MKNLQTLLQINDYPLRYKERLLWLLKIAVTILCLWFILRQLRGSAYPPDTLILLQENALSILLVLVLMPLNWCLEIVKWKKSVPDEELTLTQSTQAVLSGLALNWVLPFTLGDVGGRLTFVKNLKQSGVALIVVRAISLLLTIGLGGYSILFYLGYASAYFLVIIGVLTGLFLLARIYGMEKIRSYYRVILLSVFRYFVFTVQFVILIGVLVPGLSLQLIVAGVGWIFLFRSLLPSLFGNFGVREASAMLFFEHYLDTPSLILLPCVLIWVINTVIPSVVGAFFIFKLRVNIAQ